MSESQYSYVDREPGRRYFIEELVVKPVVHRLQEWKPEDGNKVKIEIEINPELIAYLFHKPN